MSSLEDHQATLDSMFPTSLFDGDTSSSDEGDAENAETLVDVDVDVDLDVEHLLSGSLFGGGADDDTTRSSSSDSDDLGGLLGFALDDATAAPEAEEEASSSAAAPAVPAAAEAAVVEASPQRVTIINLSSSYPRGMPKDEFLDLFSGGEYERLVAFHEDGGGEGGERSEWCKVSTLRWILGDRSPSLRMKPSWLAQQLGRKCGLSIPAKNGMNREWFRTAELGQLLMGGGDLPLAAQQQPPTRHEQQDEEQQPEDAGQQAEVESQQGQAPAAFVPSSAASAAFTRLRQDQRAQNGTDALLTIDSSDDDLPLDVLAADTMRKRKSVAAAQSASTTTMVGAHAHVEEEEDEENTWGVVAQGSTMDVPRQSSARRSLSSSGGKSSGTMMSEGFSADSSVLDLLLAPTVFSTDIPKKTRRHAVNAAAWRSVANAAHIVAESHRPISARCCTRCLTDGGFTLALMLLNGVVIAWQGLALQALDLDDALARPMRPWARALGHACSLDLFIWLLLAVLTSIGRYPLSVRCTHSCSLNRFRNIAALFVAIATLAHVVVWLVRECVATSFSECASKPSAWWNNESSLALSIALGALAVVLFALVAACSGLCFFSRRELAYAACGRLAAYVTCAAALVAVAMHTLLAQTQIAELSNLRWMYLLPGPATASLDWGEWSAASEWNATEVRSHAGDGTLFTRLLRVPFPLNDDAIVAQPALLLFPWAYFVALLTLLSTLCSAHKFGWRIFCCGWMCPLTASAQLHKIDAAGGELLRVGFSIDGGSYLACCSCRGVFGCCGRSSAKRRDFTWRAGQWVLIRKPGMCVFSEWKVFFLATGDDGSGEATIIARSTGQVASSLGLGLARRAAPFPHSALLQREKSGGEFDHNMMNAEEGGEGGADHDDYLTDEPRAESDTLGLKRMGRIDILGPFGEGYSLPYSCASVLVIAEGEGIAGAASLLDTLFVHCVANPDADGARLARVILIWRVARREEILALTEQLLRWAAVPIVRSILSICIDVTGT